MPIDFNVDRLLTELTLDEKLSLLAGQDWWHTAAIERLNIPSVRVSDGPNGIRGTRFFACVPSACFPNGTALASTFNEEILESAGELMALEAKHKGAKVILGPTANIQRGPLGGRGFESFSEDPYLSGVATAAVVNGIQKSNEIAATVKHFVCNDMEHERFSSNSIVSERALREIYLEPFRLAVKHAQPKLFMTSYNKLNGIHCSSSKKLLQDILRNDWNSGATVISDWFGITDIVDSIQNGLDIEFPGPTRYRKPEILKNLLMCKTETREGGQFSIEHIDARARKVLELVKYFVEAEQSTDFPTNEDDHNNTFETAQFLRRLGNETIVLLKNETKLLPLDKKDDIVVIGPNAKAKNSSGGGCAALNGYYTISPLEGIANVTQRKTGDIPYTKGCDNHKNLSNLIEQCTNDADPEKKGAEMNFYTQPREVRGKEKPFDSYIIDQSFITLFDYKHEKVDEKKRLFYCTIEGYFIPKEDGDFEFQCQVLGTALFYIDDKLVINNKDDQTAGNFGFGSGTAPKNNIVTLEKGRKYKIFVDYGSGVTSKLSQSIAAGALQIGVNKVIDAEAEIKKAAELASKHDKVILVIGLNGEIESEGYDRDNMQLPRRTNDLVTAVLKANPNTVIVNQSGTPVEFPWLQQATTLLQAYYGGNELGNSIADVVFGDANPSGKLSLSWPLKNEDNPAYLNFKTVMGRVLYGEDIYVGYRFYEKLQRQVAYPFGHGLSYTTFKFNELDVSGDDESLKVELSVANTGKVDGKEVVQVYVARTSPSAVPRPVKELKKFKKVALKAGESAKVELTLSVKDSCSYFDEFHNQWHLEAGKYQVLVGSSSDDIHLIGDFEVKESEFWLGL
ncbi:Beta-glucosidase [Hanseniaspora osmophila]|uniref:beta-glucosidase n=1 Tax=Hanseniaspora osmophila TaxID=56408 RepID=A0A1E5RB07_9ASCO|nr:Beta-glucosidase [Hanseniaspora osmophila]